MIYAPLHQAPVVHVRVLYHVGSRDERPDRQGFAHMFEHMMFRGSAHVKPEEHMKLIGIVGGISNAFTSFDQTVYHDTVPANQLWRWRCTSKPTAWPASRSREDIYKTERKVVAEEWRIRQNRPYGTLYEDFLKNAFSRPQLPLDADRQHGPPAAAPVSELQDFFNTYYLPNNAVLVIAGDIDVRTRRRRWCTKYFGWIPQGPGGAADDPAGAGADAGAARRR